MRDTGCFLGEVISSFEISAEEPHIPFDVARQQPLAIFIGEFTVNTYRGRPGNSSYLSRSFTAFLEASNCATEDDETGSVGGVPVAFAIDLLDPTLLLQLLNQVFIERHLEFRGQLDLVRLDHHDPDRGCIYLRQMPALRLQERLLRVRQIRSIRGWISSRWDACMRPQSD